MGILICTFNLFHQAETIVEASNITDEVSVEVISENNKRQGNKTTKKIKTNKKKLYEKKNVMFLVDMTFQCLKRDTSRTADVILTIHVRNVQYYSLQTKKIKAFWYLTKILLMIVKFVKYSYAQNAGQMV